MKFGKEFTSQMVPEWHEAYMNYNYLKSLLKDIQIHNAKPKPHHHNHTDPSTGPQTLTRKLSLYRAFSGLIHIPRHAPPLNPSSPDLEAAAPSPPIVIHSSAQTTGDKHETMFLMAGEEGGEYELVYFKRLDDEFNKVVKFYKGKVEEVVKEAEELNKQMDAFIAFRIKVERPDGWFDHTAEITRLASDIDASTAAISAATPVGARNASRRVHMEMIEEGGSSHGGVSSDEDSVRRETEMTSLKKDSKENQKTLKSRGLRPAPLEVLDRVKFHNHLETPRSTIKGFLNVPRQHELKFSRENLKKVEDKLKVAFVEFYHKLRLLKSYSFLNMLAFSKIMKKYDKITERSASRPYLKIVDDSFLGSSEDVAKLMERVESTFIKHFSNSNRSKGMNILRPKAKRDRHRVTFSTGYLAGGATALIVALILIIRARHIVEQRGSDRYMETMFPLYSLFGFVFLHIVMYAMNIYFWRQYRVNYSFIFGYKKGTELGYIQVFQLAFGIAVLGLISILCNLDMEMDPKTHDYKAITELLPLMVVLLVVAILFCPFNIIYKSSRYFFLTCLFHCVPPIMPGIPVPFSDIAKPANDLLNKDFYHTTAANLEVKSKAPNGVVFNVKGKSAHDGPISGSIEGKYTDKATGLALTQTWTTSNSLDTKLELEDNLTKGLKAEVLTNYLPAKAAYGGKLNLFYKQPNIHTRLFTDLFKGPTASFDVTLGHEGFLIGAEGGYDVGKAAITKYALAAGYSQGSYAAAVTATNNLQVFSASYYHKVNTEVEAGAKATWDSTSGSNVGLEVATKYKLDPSSFAKAKINDRGIAALAYNVKLGTGVTLGLGASLDTQNLNQAAHKVGASFTFEG